MMARPGANAIDALTDGTARVIFAPAVLAGTVALALVVTAGPAASLLGPGAAAVNGFLELSRSGMIGFSTSGVLIAGLLWPFLCGGILDRYARNRPTRGRGFFGACGAHFGAMVRLSVIAWLIYGALILLMGRAVAQNAYGRGAVIVLTLAASLVIGCARIRLVVEDRRSAIGACLAGARFVRRNIGAAGALFLLYLMITAALDWLDAGAGIAPAAGRCVFALALFAWETALFQSRLAHASYTAGPPLEWPESPAAEAIANAPPFTTS
ncbi:MAG TPA: hypothetical protein VL225_00645 [Vicinamibacterales bacterium]|nr:hypothetical protein [Vicinamibacterales bacterium]